ncbi:hypothetical protein [Massilia endophytica]|uniref:hypothetical protein n=1 Tax=Massilia endophytica TaxID=2899220 RepID=UPI001E57C0F8|nr:hypothetical protein [Massilia endophytica]UGQ44640.1 hypothetical protein LSQ66_12565 [Massilia endophytica]
MDIHLHSHRMIARQPDWTVAAIAGFGAGGILMLAELAFAMAMGSDPWRTPRLVAAFLMGDAALQTTGYSAAVLAAALAVHYLLGAAFGVALACLIAPFQLDSSLGMVLLTGFGFGLALYLFNFYVMTSAFPWFAEMRDGYTLLGHVVFGMAAAWIYRWLERPYVQA